MSRDGPEIDAGETRLTVRPAPARSEAAAIVVALRALSRTHASHPTPVQSAWRLAARREELRMDLAVSVDGWRLSARLER